VAACNCWLLWVLSCHVVFFQFCKPEIHGYGGLYEKLGDTQSVLLCIFSWCHIPALVPAI
jgi:hypothetical protein